MLVHVNDPGHEANTVCHGEQRIGFVARDLCKVSTTQDRIIRLHSYLCIFNLQHLLTFARAILEYLV